MSSPSFWSGKKIAVTGGCGFIGSNLVRRLIEGGGLVYVLDSPKHGRLNPVFESVRKDIAGIIPLDIRDYDQVYTAFARHSIDTCFHLAAQSLVGEAYQDPLPTFDTNIRGTIHILEAMRKSGCVERLVNASTTHVYGDNKNVPYLESYYPQPSRPYETSKSCADIIAQTYHYSYGLPVAIVRAANTFGPGDLNMSRLVPKTMKALLEGRDPEIIGGTAKRDFIFVDDVVSGYLAVAEGLHRPGIAGHAFNLGSGVVMSAIDIARKIVEVVGESSRGVQVIPSDAYDQEIPEQYVSIEKARLHLGWQPEYSLEAGLAKTYDWYKSIMHKHEIMI